VRYSRHLSIEECRRFYSEEVRLADNIQSTAVVETFARVPREDFLGPGPWEVACPDLGGTSMLSATRRDVHEQSDTCVVHGADVCLSSEEIS
jgi:hypothetical protein